jgi:hypothetical protein
VIDGINELNRELKCLPMNLRVQSDCGPFRSFSDREKVWQAVDFDAKFQSKQPSFSLKLTSYSDSKRVPRTYRLDNLFLSIVK